uniref:Putative acyltransferase n=1 Tax=Desulfovibrio sp. U5L TaxID=596152 RepID=I2Q1S8_9BACT
MRSTRDAVDYIKGFCIFVIAWGHLLYNNFPGKFTYFGNQFVAFFFVVSGYGIFLSLSGRVGENGKIDVASFYKKRFQRILPLYWVWFVIASFFSNPPGFQDIFLFRMYDPPVWFMNAIAHCYVLAPLLFLLIRRLEWLTLPVLCLFLYLVNASFRAIGLPDMLVYGFRKIYLFHIFLFGIGMLLPYLLSVKCDIEHQRKLIAILFGIFLLASLQTSNDHLELLDLAYIKLPYFHINKYNIILTLSVLVICFVMIQAKPAMPLQRTFVMLGKYSLPLYLFHTFYVNLVVLLLGKTYPLIVYFVAFTFFFPVLLGVCILLQQGTDRLCSRFGGQGVPTSTRKVMPG